MNTIKNAAIGFVTASGTQDAAPVFLEGTDEQLADEAIANSWSFDSVKEVNDEISRDQIIAAFAAVRQDKRDEAGTFALAEQVIVAAREFRDFYGDDVDPNQFNIQLSSSDGWRAEFRDDHSFNNMTTWSSDADAVEIFNAALRDGPVPGRYATLCVLVETAISFWDDEWTEAA